MVKSNATLPDRKTSLHLLGRENETWYGLLVKSTSKNKDLIVSKLTKILIEHRHTPAENNEEWIYAKGNFDSETIREIECYLRSAKGIIGSPIMPKGRYFSFLGSSWLRKYQKKY